MSAENPDPLTLTAVQRVREAMAGNEGWGLLRYPGNDALAITFAVGAAIVHPSEEPPDPDRHPVYTIPEMSALGDTVRRADQEAIVDLVTARRGVISRLPADIQRHCTPAGEVPTLSRLRGLESLCNVSAVGGAVIAFADLIPNGFVQSADLARAQTGYSSWASGLRTAERQMAATGLRNMQYVITANAVDGIPAAAKDAEISNIIKINSRPGASVHLATDMPGDIGRQLKHHNIVVYITPDGGRSYVATAEVIRGKVPNINPLPNESPWRVADQQYFGPNSRETLELLELVNTTIDECVLSSDHTVEALKSWGR